MKQNRFLISSEDCELLLALEKNGTVEKTAQAVCKDPSGVSRQLKRIADTYPAIEKRNGKWMLTSVGKRLNSHTRDSIQIQQQLAANLSVLRIGTNREFGSRIVGPHLESLKEQFSNSKIMIYTFEDGTEDALLNGKIDLGIDCQRPHDPDISYKLVLDEPIVSVCSKSFFKKYKKQIENNRLYECPHLLCERLYPDKILSKNTNELNTVAFFNDIATTRAACVNGSGWALLPRYSVKYEIKNKELLVIDEKTKGLAKYGVWSLRSRKINEENATKLCAWLKTQKL